MRVAVQFTEDTPRDYVMFPAREWVTRTEGKRIHHLNVQGVTFVGDWYHVKELPDGSVVVTGWNDDPADWTPETRTAWVTRFHPIDRDPEVGGMYNTRQTFQVFVHPSHKLWTDTTPRARQVLPLDEFVRPPMAECREGLEVTDVLHAAHLAARTPRGWRHWTEGIPADHLTIRDGREIIKPRATGRIQHTATRAAFLSDDTIASTPHTADHELRIGFSPTYPTTAGTVTVEMGDPGQSGQLEAQIVWGLWGANLVNWPNGLYSVQLDVTAGDNDVDFGFMDLGGTEGHFGQLDVFLTHNETVAQTQGAFNGSGIKTASVTWNAASGATTDSLELVLAIIHTNAPMHGTDAWTIELNEADDIILVPWSTEQSTTAASLDALLKAEDQVEVASLDGLLMEVRTVLASLDAVLAGGAVTLQITAALDALLKAEDQMEVASLDAILMEKRAIQAALDGLLQKSQTLAASLDAVLSGKSSAVASLSAVLLATFQATASLDARLVNRLTEAASLDALLQKEQTIQAALDAILSGTSQVAASLDGLLQATQTETASLSALLQAEQTIQASLDGILSGTSQVTASLDGVLLATSEVQAALDGILKANQVEVASLDALLLREQIVTASLDAILSGGGAVTLTVTALLDAILQATFQVNASLDARLVRRLVEQASLSALLKQSGQTKVAELDALVTNSLWIPPVNDVGGSQWTLTGPSPTQHGALNGVPDDALDQNSILSITATNGEGKIGRLAQFDPANISEPQTGSVRNLTVVIYAQRLGSGLTTLVWPELRISGGFILLGDQREPSQFFYEKLVWTWQVRPDFRRFEFNDTEVIKLFGTVLAPGGGDARLDVAKAYVFMEWEVGFHTEVLLTPSLDALLLQRDTVVTAGLDAFLASTSLVGPALHSHMEADPNIGVEVEATPSLGAVVEATPGLASEVEADPSVGAEIHADPNIDAEVEQ